MAELTGLIATHSPARSGDVLQLAIHIFPERQLFFSSPAGFTVYFYPQGSATAEAAATFANGLIVNASSYSAGVRSRLAPTIIIPQLSSGTKDVRLVDDVTSNALQLVDFQGEVRAGILVQKTYEAKVGDTIELALTGDIYPTTSGFTVSFFPFGSSSVEAIATFGNGLIANSSAYNVAGATWYNGAGSRVFPRVTIPPLSVGTKQIRLNDTSSSNLVTLTIYKGFDLKPTSLGQVGDAASVITLELQNETGLGFTEPGLVIKLGGEVATITSQTVNTVSVITGMTGQTPGLKSIEIEATKRTSTTFANSFNYTGSARVVSISPSVGVYGVTNYVEITGLNFVDPATVTFQGVSASSIVVVSPTKITCTLAPESRSGYVYVSTPNGPSLLSSQALAFTIPPVFASGANPPVVNVSTVSIDATTSADNPSSAGGTIDTYDASGVGAGFTKNHYHQVYNGTEQLSQALITQHGPGQLTSRISAVGLKGVVRLDNVIPIQGSLRSYYATKIYNHNGTHVTGFQQLHTPLNIDGSEIEGQTAIVALRFGYDDSSVYTVFTVEELTLSGVNQFTATNSAFLFPIAPAGLPAATPPNFTPQGAIGSSIGNDAYERLRSNLIALKALIEAEHDTTTGNHEVPLSRFDGYSLAYDGAVTAPTNIGAWTWVKIAGPGYSTKRFFQPALVGAAGSGIVVATLCYATSGVYVRLLRITSGVTNAFTMKCVSISDS